MTNQLPIYLDNHSTTPLDPRVLEEMLPYFTRFFGNAASRHHEYGWKAEAAVENARTKIASLIVSEKDEIVFTSGATESINLAIKGTAEGFAKNGNHVITAATEHSAVLDSCKRLEQYGFTVTVLPVDESGLISIENLSNAITDKTILVSVMLANNEIGTIAPLVEISRVCKERNVVFHSDGTQAAGRIHVDVGSLGVDLFSFSAHKMYGPKGVGALYVKKRSPKLNLIPQVDGGGHENGFRSGTLNVPGIVGFGKAAEIASLEMKVENERVASLRDKLVSGLRELLPDIAVNGHPSMRLPNNANILFVGAKAGEVMMKMKDIAVSSGSACSAATAKPSHVLKAIGLEKDSILSSIRFGLGRFTTEEEIDFAIRRVSESVEAVRAKNYHHQPAHS